MGQLIQIVVSVVGFQLDFPVLGAACSPLPLVRAIYSYLAQGPDELSLKEGDIIELISGQTAEDGWWEGNCCF